MMSTANNFYLKLRTKDKNLEIRNFINGGSSFDELLKSISNFAGIRVPNLKILSGYPRKPLVFPPNETLEQCGIKCGDTLFVVEEENFNSTPLASAPSAPFESVATTSSVVQAISKADVKSHITDTEQRNGVHGILLKRVVPSDNSCLFTSFEFVVSGKLDPSASAYMRELVASIISSQPDDYNEAILGQPNENYCKWILNPNSWGGAIELAVLSNNFGFEIAVVNSITGLISRFGEDKQYDQRVFLLFDGIHYDPLYMDFAEIDKIQTIFPTNDAEVYLQAEQLAKEAKASRQFTDVNQFMIRCSDCSSVFVGQLEARKHAEKTGHTSFSEVNS